ncbi:MAG: hypothetical protein AB8G22_17110 [Saprospiraceae bacterium]
MSDEAKKLLANLETQLPKQHIYFSLVKNELLQGESKAASAELIQEVLTQVNQKIRREYILEHLLA